MPILDVTNPTVRSYIEHVWLAPALTGGFQGIAFDNSPAMVNTSRACGHYDTDGMWIAQYSGSEYNDPAYTEAQARPLGQIVTWIHRQRRGATVTVNDGYYCASKEPSLWQQAVAPADMILDEEGFTDGGHGSPGGGPMYETSDAGKFCANRWLSKMQAYERLQTSVDKGLVLVNQEPYTVTTNLTTNGNTTVSATQARFDLQWALANYLLISNGRTYFWWGGHQQYGHGPFFQAEYSKLGLFNSSPVIGSPLDPFYASQHVYMRRFTNGLALVNPSPSSNYAVRFTPGKYSDLYGHQVASRLMPPHSGLILLARSRGLRFASISIKHQVVRIGAYQRVIVHAEPQRRLGIWMHVYFPSARTIAVYSHTDRRGQWVRAFKISTKALGAYSNRVFLSVRLWYGYHSVQASRIFYLVR